MKKIMIESSSTCHECGKPFQHHGRQPPQIKVGKFYFALCIPCLEALNLARRRAGKHEYSIKYGSYIRGN